MTPSARHPSPRTQHPAPILALGFLAALPVAFTSISNPDLPWHLSAARFMVEHRALPGADFLSWSMAGTPWMDFEWGTQLLYYGLHRAGGDAALWLFKALVFAALLGLFAALMGLWRMPALWTALAGLPLLAALLPNLDIRPENLTLLLFLLQFYALESWRLDRKGPLPLALSPKPLALFHFALYALWSNLHAGFAMGLTLGGIYGAGAAAEALLPRVYDPRARADLGALKPWALAGLAALAGTCVNPFGPAVYSVSLEHFRLLPVLSRHIQEWAEPSVLEVSQWPFWAMLLFSFPVLAWHFARTRRTPLAHLLALAFLGVGASHYARHTAFFCLTAFPAALLALRGLALPAGWRQVRTAAFILGWPAFAVWVYFSLLPPDTFRRVSDPVYEPAGACAFLAREKGALGGLRLYNPWSWGGFVGWTLYPDYKVFVDGRYLFHAFLPEIRQAQQSPDDWDRFLSRHGIDLVLVENRAQWFPEHSHGGGAPVWRPAARFFFPRDRWAMVFWDAKAIVLVRRGKVPAPWLARHEFRFLFPRDQAWLQSELRAGRVRLSALEAEAGRYQKQAGDPETLAKIRSWLEEQQSLETRD